jgi:prephenate dehydrogenase
MKISVIGLGLIGGSFSLAIKKTLEKTHVKGWDLNADHISEAEKLGIINSRAESEDDALLEADWIFLATPVDAIENRLSYYLDKITKNQLYFIFYNLGLPSTLECSLCFLLIYEVTFFT